MGSTKISLLNDYNSVAHPSILEVLQTHLGEKFEGYSTDHQVEEAKAALLELFKNPKAEAHLIPAGTLTNLIACSAFLRPHEAVVAPFTAHVSMHETGAIEATGHKVFTQESKDGKLRPEDIVETIKFHTDEHMIKPRMAYISQTTEFGGVYTRKELEALREVCDENDMLLYIDGARLAYALSSDRCDFELPLIAELADAFYLGGTKNGLLFGEALIICNPDLQEDFRFIIKQRGGLLAKGFLLGIQFKALLEDDLYLKLAAAANVTAARLSLSLQSLGYRLEIPTESNQVFPIVNNDELLWLHDNIDFEQWHRLDAERISIRFVTTWETTEDDIQAVLDLMSESLGRSARL